MTPPVGREMLEGFEGRQDFRLEQTPKRVVGIVLAHVGGGGQQEEVMRMPRQ